MIQLRTPVGRSNSARFFQQVVLAIKELRPLKTDEYGIEQTASGWRLSLRRIRTGRSGAAIAQMLVKDIQDDYLNCLQYDSVAGQSPPEVATATQAAATEADWIKVAKPYELRFTDWDGETVDGLKFSYALADFDWARRKATRVSDDFSEIQIVARPWYVGEILYAGNGISGGTFAFDSDEQAIDWLDLNNAGRAWAKTPNSDPIDSTL